MQTEESVKERKEGIPFPLKETEHFNHTKIEETPLSRSESILKAVTKAGEIYLKEPDLSTERIETMLSLIGNASGVSRVYVFENHQNDAGKKLSSQRYEWVIDSISPQKNNPEMQNFSWEDNGLSSWPDVLRQGYAIKGSVKDMTESEREVFTAQEILSIALMPIFVNHKYWGFIGFDECIKERIWQAPEIDALKSFSIFLGSMIERSRIEASHKQSIIRYRAIVEDQTDLICRYLKDGSLTFVNSAFCRFFEKSEKVLLGEKLYDLLSEDDRTKWLENITVFEQNIHKSPIREGFEHAYHKIEGEKRWVRWMDRAILDDHKNITEFQSVGKDITEEKELRKVSEYRLQQCIQADKLASLGEVVAGVAHEINNPNSFIVYNIPLFEETWEAIKPVLTGHAQSNPEYKVQGMSMDELFEDMDEIIESIKEGSDRITNVISNLREFSRFQTNTPPKPFDVNEAIDKTLSIVGATVRKSIDEFIKDLDKGIPKVSGYISKVEQVIANLVVNATKSIRKKRGSRLTITTRYIKRLHAVLVEIQDTGQGMKKEVVDKIFDPFFTTDRETGKAGLGLAVSHHLIEENKGVIGVLSRPDIGTKFSIYLPVNGEKLASVHPTILCVDDDPAMLDLIKTYSYSVLNIPMEPLQDPSGIIDFLKEHPEIDLVLSDIIMPEKNGWELLSAIRDYDPLIGVILYSGYPDAIHPKKGYKQKPDAVLSKPINLNKLIHTINKIGRSKL